MVVASSTPISPGNYKYITINNMQKDELLDLDVIKIVQQENKNACLDGHFDWQLLFVMLY